MRKLIVNEHFSLDGVVQAPGAPDEDHEGGFEHGGWTAPFSDERVGQFIIEGVERAEVLLLGRKTYDIFAAYWPHASDDASIAVKFNSMPKYVASRTLQHADWNNTTILSGDAAEEVRQLKQRGEGEIHVWGSSQLVQTLMGHDLVDEFHLVIYPVLIGSGKRLFADGTIPGSFSLAKSIVSDSGVIAAVYAKRGGLEYGRADSEQE